MKKLNKKAMTLFELLAVIIILGVVALIAFPTVNRLIENQRKSAFAEEANLFVQVALQFAEDEKDFLEGNETTYFLNPVATDKGRGFDITNEFPKLTQDYYGKVVFEVDKGKFNILEIVFYNKKYKIQKLTPYPVSTRFKRNDIENV